MGSGVVSASSGVVSCAEGSPGTAGSAASGNGGSTGSLGSLDFATTSLRVLGGVSSGAPAGSGDPVASLSAGLAGGCGPGPCGPDGWSESGSGVPAAGCLNITNAIKPRIIATNGIPTAAATPRTFVACFTGLVAGVAAVVAPGVGLSAKVPLPGVGVGEVTVATGVGVSLGVGLRTATGVGVGFIPTGVGVAGRGVGVGV